MKPEHHLDCHVDYGGEIITAPDVAEFVRHDRFHLPRSEAIRNLVRQQQNRPENTKHARFSECRRTLHRQTDRQIKWRCVTHRYAYSAPVQSPAANQRHETDPPHDRENSDNHVRVRALNRR